MIPGEEAPGEAGVGTSKPCSRASYEVLIVFAVKELVDVCVANIAGPQASQLVMLTPFAKMSVKVDCQSKVDNNLVVQAGQIARSHRSSWPD